MWYDNQGRCGRSNSTTEATEHTEPYGLFVSVISGVFRQNLALCVNRCGILI